MSKEISLEYLRSFKLSSSGLSFSEVELQLKNFGKNEIKDHAQKKQLDIIIESLKDPMIWFLLMTGTLHFFLGELKESLLIFLSLVPILLMDYFLNLKTEASLKNLKSHLFTKVKVRRESKVILIKSSEIVPGDIFLIDQNQFLPVDGLVVKSHYLQVDESPLTGESIPLSKIEIKDFFLNWYQSSIFQVNDQNLVYAGTKILSGEGEILVLRTGDQTEYAKIITYLTSTSDEKTPLQKVIQKLIYILIIFSGILCVIQGLVSFYKGHGLVNSILSAATLAIAALPEEFPVVFTFYLGLGVYRLAKQHALVRKAVSVENIGRVGHILTDKTGTLTFGHLKLAHVIPRDEFQNDLIISALTASQSNNSDPLNQGIFEYTKNDVSSKKTASKVFPFTEDRKKESVIDSEGTCHSKGAPEVIINQCELNPMERSFWLDKVNHLSKEGHKVIACSRRLNLVTQEVEPEEGYHFLGLLAFEDSPRPEVKEAMSFCLSNQIKVTMITGDHLETAKALANEIGLSESELKCISAEDNLEKFTSEWVMNNPGYFESFHVIARCRPSQKALVVQSLKNDQTVIAVTGDGINDVPALKSADISIAMGKRGDQSAKEISHIILMDDNFSSIVNAIKEGKILYSNLKRSFHYLILIHIPFVLSAAIIPFFHFTVLYYPSLVVWIELLIHPSAILGFSQGRLGNSSLRSTLFFDKSELWEIIGLSSVVLIFMLARFFLSLSQAGDEDYARSVVFSILLIWNSVVLFHLGDLKSKILIIVILSTFLPSLFLLQFGHLSALFHLTPLSSWDWGISALFLLTLIGIVRFKKVIFS